MKWLALDIGGANLKIANGDDFITADEITNGQVTVTIGLENTNAVAGDTLTVNGTEITLTEEQIAEYRQLPGMRTPTGKPSATPRLETEGTNEPLPSPLKGNSTLPPLPDTNSTNS